MENSNERAPLKNSVTEMFGNPHRRRPIPSNSFNTLISIFSLFSENPFSEFASHAKPSDNLHNEVFAPRGEKEACNEPVDSANVELSVHDKSNNEGIAGDLRKDVSFSGSKLIKDDLPCVEEGTDDGMTEVARIHEELSGIERTLMDESDDLDVLLLPDEGTNLDFLNGFSSILDTDVSFNNLMTVESSVNGEMTVDGDMKEDLTGKRKRKDLEVKKLSSGGDESKSDSHLSAIRVTSDSPEVVNQYARKKRKVCKEKFSQDLPDFGGLTSSAQKSKNEGVSNTIRKENESGKATKGKTEKTEDTSVKDVKSRKNKLSCIDSRTSYTVESRGADPVVRGKMVKQNVCGNTGKFSAKKVGNSRPKDRERVKYSREELLNLRKMTSIPEDILKIVREIDAQLHHRKDRNSAVGKMSEGGVSNNEELGLGALTEDKMAKDKGSRILKDRKRGSTSETKKEKKKRQKRKKRAEMNKKLGVKRLKLQPVVKPKVISHCRHYLKGRCQEGEKCKFSHDVIPLTKSKPCCHFARQACMKGDDCPFDHQLSNYPCNSYVAAGFCSRGDSCLFSHKIPSGATAGGPKCETTFLDPHDKSNSKRQLNDKVSFSFETSTPKCLKENSAGKTILQAKAPKGLSFLSSGKSLLKDSGKHEKADLSPKSSVAAGTSGQPNTAATAADLAKTLMDTPASDTPQSMKFLSFVRNSVGSLGDKKQSNPSFHGDNSSFHSFGKTLLQESTKHEKVGSSNRIAADGGGGGGGVDCNQLSKGISSRVLTLGAPSSGGSLYNKCGDESKVTLPASGHLDFRIKEKESTDKSEKALQQKLWASPSSLGHGAKNTSSAAQSALLSAATFASGIKVNSATISKEVAKNEGTSSGSERRQNEPSKASAILEFLYSGGNKEKQRGGS